MGMDTQGKASMQQHRSQENDSPTRRLARAAGQPLLLAATLALWLALGADGAAIGLAWLALFQFLVGLITLPCLSCRAASFVHRRAVEKREEEEQQQAALIEQGADERVLS